MKTKIILTFTFIIIIATAFAPRAFAYEPELILPPGFDTQLEAVGADSLLDALPSETRDALHELGIDGIDLYSLLRASPRDIINQLLNMLQGGIGRVIRSGAAALGVVLLLSFAFSIMPGDEKTRRTLEVTGSMLALILMLPGLAELMRAAAAVIEVGANFSLMLIPILAGILTASGRPMLAVSYHGLTFAAAQGLSQLARGVVVPTTGIVLGLSLVDGAAQDTRLSALANAIKKTVIGTFAVLASLFTALLSIKSVITNTADALVIRGVRVLASSVPVVGGAISEATSAILSSVNLVKGAVGGFALIAALLLYAPTLVELLLWSVMLKLLAGAAELFGQSKSSGVFKSAAYAVAILAACVIFNAALLLISTGLVITMRGV